ncbi:glycoside hydrolase family 3 [Candidatus Saccharibacteria bacterium]|nr:glycoside hydrolase family 3 [Candidatus Saccharibacteria bacterium]
MRKFLVGLLVLAIVGGGAAIWILKPWEGKMREEQPAASEPEVDKIKEKLDKMTLDEKIAQMIIPQAPRATLSETTTEKLETAPYGGYILMGDNYRTLAKTREFVQKLQSLAKTPLIITTDEEGGSVQRIANITNKAATDIPFMYQVGQTGDLSKARTIGRVLAEELRVIGVNVDTAPDADVYSNPYNTVIGQRSFSSDPEVVAKMSLALAEGLEENGVMATFKHFPGHGNTATDSHSSLPIVESTREELNAVDLVPFKNAISNGAKMIMVGHIALPNVAGDDTPASLSYKLTTDLLRKELGFDGLIMTDGLNMGALVNNYEEAEIYRKAVEAGADLLLLPTDPELAAQTIKETISEARINESVYRILDYKEKYLSNYEYLDDSYFGSEEHREAVKL